MPAGKGDPFPKLAQSPQRQVGFGELELALVKGIAGQDGVEQAAEFAQLQLLNLSSVC